ncbi:polysaccharide pyruvyl transferase family protein [Paenibacillus tarimensis]
MKQYVVIVGGELFNKGAQALTFTVVDKVKERYPGVKIVLLSSMDYRRPEGEKRKYAFEILPFPLDLKSDLLGGIYKSYDVLSAVLNKRKANRDIRNKVTAILSNCRALIDISGYALSSQRGKFNSLQYLLNLKIARKYRIPVYLFPQSYGPFEYGYLGNLIFHQQIKKELSSVKEIYAREQDGLHNLQRLNLNNVKRSFDIVLQNNKPYNLSNIFIREQFAGKHPEILPEAVGIIPNVKIMKHGNEEALYKLYEGLVDHLLKNNKNIYFLRHSYEDNKVIQAMREKYPNERQIFYLDHDYSCIEIDEMIKKFDFIIGSRYHSIVHAFKNYVPALVLGWAVKYDELLQAFGQTDYCFDVRKQIKTEEAISKIDTLLTRHKQESETIKKNYAKITENNIFDKLII